MHHPHFTDWEKGSERQSNSGFKDLSQAYGSRLRTIRFWEGEVLVLMSCYPALFGQVGCFSELQRYHQSIRLIMKIMDILPPWVAMGIKHPSKHMDTRTGDPPDRLC